MRGQTSNILSPDELQEVLQQQTDVAVRPTAFVMTLVYPTLFVSHLLLLPRPQAYFMALLALATAILTGAISRIPARFKKIFSAHDLIGILTLAVLANVGSHMVLLEDRLQTSHLAICLLAIGFLMLHRIWYASCVIIYLIVWFVAYRQLPPVENSFHFEYLIGISTAISICVHIARYRATVRAATANAMAERAKIEIDEKLTQASRLITLGELAASIAHELNQPLTAISNYATACKRNLSRVDGDTQPMQTQLKQISATAVRMGKIIKRLRHLATNTSTDRLPVDLNQIVRQSVELMASDLRTHGIQVQLKLVAGLPSVHADEVQMQQVVINLLQNGVDSIRQMSSRGTLTLETAADASGAQVTVADNGPGIQFENTHCVFDAFFTTKPDGMGMGLAICRSVVENHGGRIWCHSETDNGQPRTQFHFWIPHPAETDREQTNGSGR